MNFLLGFRIYFSLFGFKGVLLAAVARIFRKNIVVTVSAPQLQHPIHLRLRSSDVTLFRSIILDEAYDWPLAKMPAIIMDAGANIGLASVFYANKYPAARIIAIEPEGSNYQMLLKNTSKYQNIKTVQAALWNKNEPLYIIDQATGFWAFQISNAENAPVDDRNRGETLGLTMDRFLCDFRIDELGLLKIDVEGSEREIFENSVTWIDRVGVIVIELHDWIKTGCSQAVNLAAKNFDSSYQRGETTFFLKKEYLHPGGQERPSGQKKVSSRIIEVEIT